MQTSPASPNPRDATRRSARSPLASRLWVGLWSALSLLLISTIAFAQANLGAIQGTVADENGKKLGSVTVVIQGPALQEFQSEITDAGGKYIISQLPPGDDYQIAFYFGSDDKPKEERKGIRLSVGKTLTINATIRLTSTKREVKVIRESAPNVDTASASTGVEINQEILRNTPVRGRTFDSVLALAPGSADVAPRNFSLSGGGADPGSDVGVSVSGSTGAENAFFIDGVNTSDPNTGINGTELSQYFIKEITINTGGYQAEFGRATGGVINMVTKSGGNEFHGSVFGSIQPFQLDARTVARLGESLSTRTRTNLLFDVGFDLGGYLWKDRIWFYVGFAPTVQDLLVQRRVRVQTYNPNNTGGLLAESDPDYQCPSYLRSSTLCLAARSLALRTTEINEGAQDFIRTKRLYNGIAKLQFNFSPDHNLTIGYLGSPTEYDDYAGNRSLDVASQKYYRLDQIHDANARYIGRLFSRKLQIDVLYGYHYQGKSERPNDLNSANIQWSADPADPLTLADFEAVAPCQRQSRSNAAGMSQTFNPCPLTNYQRGFSLYREEVQQRHMINASLTAFLSFTGKWNPFRGIHALKVGFDFEDILVNNQRAYTGPDFDPSDPTNAGKGHRVYRTDGSGDGLQISREFAQPWSPSCPHQDFGDGVCHYNRFRGVTEARNFSVYARDSWNIGWAPGLVLNAGVRWEGQELYGMDLKSDPMNPSVGKQALSIYDNIAPRIGLTWDFTQLTNRPGRGKLFFNYGRFYTAIPTNLVDRQFTGEGLYATGFAAYGGMNPDPNCPKTPQQVGGRPVADPRTTPNCIFPGSFVNGGTVGNVAPGLQGQFINEIIAGIQYDVGFDMVFGASYIHRDLGRVIEDVSTDGAAYYFLANPGEPADPNRINDLQRDLDAARSAAMADPMNADKAQAQVNAQKRLDGYRAAGTVFPRAVRNYDALVLTLNKRLSNRFSVIGSYTYSRTIGNYPGAFSPSNGQLDPNISTQFDLTDLLANRNGPLPNDRPHNFKLTGFYVQPIGQKAQLTFGMTFSAYSGRPIEVLGTHLYYGPREVYILPRGAGGRTPPVTQFDLSVGYDQQLGRGVSLRLFADVINLFNQRAVTNVDDEYTTDVVQAVPGGTIEDLRRLRTVFGGVPVYNSNYGQPVAFQEPLYFRFGGRVSF
mgnify:CR=1 FL=1